MITPVIKRKSSSKQHQDIHPLRNTDPHGSLSIYGLVYTAGPLKLQCTQAAVPFRKDTFSKVI